jgi:hypothetical protein
VEVNSSHTPIPIGCIFWPQTPLYGIFLDISVIGRGGWGFIYQIDHLNVSTGLKFTRVMHCQTMPTDKKEEDENCTSLVANVIYFYLFTYGQVSSINFIKFAASAL